LLSNAILILLKPSRHLVFLYFGPLILTWYREQGSIRLESFVASIIEIPKVFGNVSLLCSLIGCSCTFVVLCCQKKNCIERFVFLLEGKIGISSVVADYLITKKKY
jgi:hypothetical protein